VEVVHKIKGECKMKRLIYLLIVVFMFISPICWASMESDFCDAKGFDSQASGLTCAEFIDQSISDFMWSVIRTHKIQEAVDSAIATVEQEVENAQQEVVI